MKTLTFCLLLLLNYAKLPGQHLPDELLSSPVFIEHLKGTGTGFLLQDSINLYFVTARHNFFDLTNGKLSVTETKLTTYKENPITGDKIIYKLDLNSANALGFMMPKPIEDVLIIKMAELRRAQNGKAAIIYYPFVVKMTKDTFLNPVPIEVLEKYEDVHVGDEIYTFGYPTSIGLRQMPQFDFTRPLLRKGIIAGKFDTNKSLILDCPSYPGNSGGPVIVKIDSASIIHYRLIGIVVQFIPYEEQWVNVNSGLIKTDRFNSGYSVAVSASKILELIYKK